MNPHEMWAGGMRGHPRLRVLHNVCAAAFHSSPSGFGLRVLGKVVVEIESAVEAWSERLAVENDRADERGGVVSIPLSATPPAWDGSAPEARQNR